jgi:hypothetical protein
MVVVVVALRAVLPMTLPIVVLVGATGALVYAGAVIGFALGPLERAAYVSQLRAAARWRQRPAISVPAKAAVREVA